MLPTPASTPEDDATSGDDRDHETVTSKKASRLSKRRSRKSEKKKENQRLKQLVEKHEMILNTTIHAVVLPRVAATVYKALYHSGMQKMQQKYISNDKRASVLLECETHFEQFGLKSIAEMRLFAASWDRTLSERNTVAHTVSAQDVLHVLPYADEEMTLRINAWV